MEALIACRVCLSTDNIKLYSFVKPQLAQAYEILTGTQVTVQDGLPQHICSYCSSLLLKCISFRERCCNSQEFLKFYVNEQSEVTMDYLRSINRQFKDFILPYQVTSDLPVITCDHDEMVIKEEEQIGGEVYSDEPIDDFGDVKDEQDEKLTDKPKKKVKRKKKTKPEKKTQFDTVTIKCEDAIDDDDQDLDLAQNEDSDIQELNSEELKDVEIITLTKQQQLEEIEARKTSFNYTNSLYKCDKCYKGFITAITYKNHMQRHDPKRGAYECEICLSRWPEPRCLRAHVVSTHKLKFVCKLCDHVSRCTNRAKEHAKWHNGFTFDCKICGASFAKSTSHLTHVRLQHPSNYCCEICGESFIGEYGLRMHKKRAHRERENDSPEASSCVQCSTEFQSLEALKRHLEFSRNGICDPELRPCVQCGEGLISDVLLEEHLKDHEKNDETRTFDCDECKRSFASERSYAIHYQRVHLGVKLKQNKPWHKRRSESVVCEICGKKCITKGTLTYHQRIHTGERPYQCSQCPKKFSVQQRLQIHIRTHTGECPYKCKHCPKAFKHKAALNRHDRVHTGAKPYTCSHCGKAFSQSNSMKLHVNTVHLKLPAPYRSRRNKN